MQNTKIEIIKNLSLTKEPAIINALITCLSAEDACQFLISAHTMPYYIRKAITRKIVTDIEKRSDPCHRDLIQYLLKNFSDIHYRQKQIQTQYLCSFFPLLTKGEQDEILKLLADSKYITIRRKAIKLIDSFWDIRFLTLLEKNWKRFKDFESSALIIKYSQNPFLFNNFDELEKLVLGTWLLRRLYLRLGTADSSIVKRLKNIDEITFVYISTKLKIPIDRETLISIYDKNKNSEKKGLLIWCLGQMGLWDILISIAKEL